MLSGVGTGTSTAAFDRMTEKVGQMDLNPNLDLDLDLNLNLNLNLDPNLNAWTRG